MQNCSGNMCTKHKSLSILGNQIDIVAHYTETTIVLLADLNENKRTFIN